MLASARANYQELAKLTSEYPHLVKLQVSFETTRLIFLIIKLKNFLDRKILITGFERKKV
jgi:hypothetical protein